MNRSISSLANVFEFEAISYNKITIVNNLNVFKEKLDKLIKGYIKRSKGAVLLFIDLDRFNNMDDILGFNYRDGLLDRLSKELELYMDNKGMIHKFSEDKYLVCVYDIVDLDNFKSNLEERFRNIGNLREVKDNYICNSANIGISIYPEHGHCAKELINNAKIAMHKAKELGKNRYYYFEDGIYKDMIEKKEIEINLRTALKNNEFLIYYQPQIDITTNKIYGVEALLRWNSPKYGYMSPDKFIPIAEEIGIIIEIGEWMFKEVCIHVRRWKRLGFNIRASVNISAIQLQNKGFLYKTKRIIDETNVDPYLIDFEITESILIESTKEVQRVLNEIKNMGIKISLDDFGTGYSSLVYLNKFPIDTIKIDRCFIQDLFIYPKKIAIVEGIIHIAQSIGMEVIAEGIEDKKELEVLRDKKCHRGQGYIYSEPVPINEIEEFFIKYNEKVIVL